MNVLYSLPSFDVFSIVSEPFLYIETWLLIGIRLIITIYASAFQQLTRLRRKLLTSLTHILVYIVSSIVNPVSLVS